jgi:Bifunctional DNA primase/polymerase, N-terminal
MRTTAIGTTPKQTENPNPFVDAVPWTVSASSRPRRGRHRVGAVVIETPFTIVAPLAEQESGGRLPEGAARFAGTLPSGKRYALDRQLVALLAVLVNEQIAAGERLEYCLSRTLAAEWVADRLEALGHPRVPDSTIADALDRLADRWGVLTKSGRGDASPATVFVVNLLVQVGDDLVPVSSFTGTTEQDAPHTEHELERMLVWAIRSSEPGKRHHTWHAFTQMAKKRGVPFELGAELAEAYCRDIEQPPGNEYTVAEALRVWQSIYGRRLAGTRARGSSASRQPKRTRTSRTANVKTNPEVQPPNVAAREALAFAARGFRVLPIEPGSKRPLISTTYRSASRNPATISTWADRWQDASWAVVVDKFTVIDLDPRNLPEGVTVEQLLDEHDLRELAIVRTGEEKRTGERGAHVYVMPEQLDDLDLDTLASVPGVDIFDGSSPHYVLLPGSTHASGVTYEWTDWRRLWPTAPSVAEANRIRVADLVLDDANRLIRESQDAQWMSSIS